MFKPYQGYGMLKNCVIITCPEMAPLGLKYTWGFLKIDLHLSYVGNMNCKTD